MSLRERCRLPGSELALLLPADTRENKQNESLLSKSLKQRENYIRLNRSAVIYNSMLSKEAVTE